MPVPARLPREDRIAGALLGCAVGDALGVPYEGLSRQRGTRLLGEPARMRFLFGWGLVSDDTDHSCLVLQALCNHPAPDHPSPDHPASDQLPGEQPNREPAIDPAAFQRCFAQHLRYWLLSLPTGIGRATLQAIVKLWLGFSPQRSGVFSAGNGPAMRSAVLGAAIESLDSLHAIIRAATEVTHTDPKARDGAWAIAYAAWLAGRQPVDPERFFARWSIDADPLVAPEFREAMEQLAASLRAGESIEQFLPRLGCARGVSGYVLHTVPVALHLWLTYPTDYRWAVSSAIRCGGDTDTVAAIVGGLVGATVGPPGIPAEWLRRVGAWPRSVAWMRALARATAQAQLTGQPQSMPGGGWWLCWPRNLLFTLAVLGHLARRAGPPY